MLGLDFETFCELDITKHGLDRYVNHPSFTVLMASVYDGDKSQSLRFDFVKYPQTQWSSFRSKLHSKRVAAHNASFERACLKKLNIDPARDDIDIIDSAVAARAAGAAGKLEAAAPQLLDGCGKIDTGPNLIRVFSVPTAANNGRPYTYDEIQNDPKLLAQWEEFGRYCDQDAYLAYQIADTEPLLMKEYDYEKLTQAMNDRGWFVNIPLVYEMQRRYKANVIALETAFREKYDPQGKFNVNSYKQCQEWCADRGVRSKSFDQLSISKLLMRLNAKVADPAFLAACNTDPSKWDLLQNYRAVMDLLYLKQELGGSSLTKLQTIIDTVGPGDRLRGQYMHIGAGQTYRTSGRGVQMQNLPRLAAQIGDMDELFADSWFDWDNTKLAQNIRQLFQAQDPDGQLIVGDFKSVESVGLAYIAGEHWKTGAYHAGRDVYKMLATTYSSFGGVAYEDVTPDQRRAGKVGELACGYGAGPAAVASFAERMGILMSEHEAGQIVSDWRNANANIVALWKELDDMLHGVVEGGRSTALTHFQDGGKIRLNKITTPQSLQDQHPGAQSIELSIQHNGKLMMVRVFHGCYMRGRDICYYKPSELKSGDLWRGRMSAPPHAWYKLYGGKLAGILTQSFCRELFFSSMLELDKLIRGADGFVGSNLQLIGQFHDELVLEWSPPASAADATLQEAIDMMRQAMTTCEWSNFPLMVDVKHAHNYIK